MKQLVLCAARAQNWIELDFASNLKQKLQALVVKMLPKLKAAAREAAQDSAAAPLELKPSATEKKMKAETLVKSTMELVAFLRKCPIRIRAALTFANWRFYCHAGTLFEAMHKQEHEATIRTHQQNSGEVLNVYWTSARNERPSMISVCTSPQGSSMAHGSCWRQFRLWP